MLHADMDWWMADPYQLFRMKVGTAEGNNWLIMAQNRLYRFFDSAEFLRDVGMITQKEYERLDKFDKLRNKIVHRLIIHSYQPNTRNSVTFEEVKAGYEEGLQLDKILRERTGGTGIGTIFKAGGKRLTPHKHTHD